MAKYRKTVFKAGLVALLITLPVILLINETENPLKLDDARANKTELTGLEESTRTESATAITFEALLADDSEARLTSARSRAEYMRKLIQTDPQRALRESLSFAEWSQLPQDVKPLVELPFSSLVDIEVVIACLEHESETEAISTIQGNEKFDTFLFGRRAGIGSKNNLPVQGIRLDGVATYHEDIFQYLDPVNEGVALNLYPVLIDDPGGDSVAALAGGRIFYFENMFTLEEANRRLAVLEELPGPNSGVQALFEHEEIVLNGYSSINFEELENIAVLSSQVWTGTPRDFYVIMADFSDNSGQPADPTTLQDSLNNAISQQIWEMSYEKSHIVGTVNPTTYRLPQTAAYYTSDHSALHDDAVTEAEDDGVDLSSYETVCVLFPNIAGYTWSGRASVSGSRMWLNGSTGVDLILHELGHNYGARHASSWLPTNSDPDDPGGSYYEYGDDTDVMGSGDSPEGHFNAWHKKHIGWFDSDNWQTVTAPGTYRVYRSDHQQTSGLLRGLEIDKGSGDTYWVGLRQNYPEFEYYSRGGYLLWKRSGDNRSYLLDLSPQSAGGEEDGGLALGQTYSDSAAAVHITATARGGMTPDEWMEFTINLGSFPGNNSPTASLSGPTTASARSNALFSVTASDLDGDELAYFWDIGDGLVKPNSPTLPVAWVKGGSYTVSCTISDMKGGTVQVSQGVTVSDSLDIWTKQTSGTTEHLNDVAVGGSRIVAVGNDAITLYSDNGTSWTSHQSFDVNSVNIYLEGITYDGSQFISVGMDYDFGQGGWEQTIYTSSNGTSWTERYDSDSGSGSNFRLRDIAYGNGIYIAVGDDGTIIRSTNSTSWSPATSGTTEDLDSVAYGDGVFVIASSASGGGPAIVLTSADGLTWTDYSSGVDLSTWKGFYDIEYCNDRFLASGWYARIMYSHDQGQTFTTFMTGDRPEIAGFAYGNGIYFAAGINNDNGGADVNYVSLDGTRWTELTTSSQDNRNAAAFFIDSFYTVGNSGAIWKSNSTPIPTTSFAVWQLQNMDTLGFNRDPMDDADFDSYLNIDEYALGSLATSATSLPDPGASSHDGTYLQVTYQRDGIKSDINYTGEWSTDMSSSSWSTSDTTITEDTATHITIESNHTLSSEPKQFLRLSMELQ
ncbi:MAG: PKD domain-containing protein [Puniceicoccaceae bacterium]